MWFNTRAVVLTSGRGSGSREIVAFDAALRASAIADFNLIKVTSIVPPGVPVYRLVCDDLEAIDGRGHMLPTVYAKVSSEVIGERITAAVGLGVPDDNQRSGVIFIDEQRHGTEDQCVDGLAAMVAEGMTMLRRTDSYSFHNASASAQREAGAPGWCTVLAALSFVDEDLWPYFEDRVVPLDTVGRTPPPV
jgi:arginine decarboxylase